MTVDNAQKKIQPGILNIQAMVKGYVYSENKVKDPNVILTVIEPKYFFLYFHFLPNDCRQSKVKIQPGFLNIQAIVKGYVQTYPLTIA